MISDDQFFDNERELKRSREDAKAARARMQAAVEKYITDPVARREVEKCICEYVAAIERNAMALECRNSNR